MRSDLHDIEVIFQTSSERAFCVRSEEDGDDVWLPKSGCEIEGPLERGAIVTLTAGARLLTDKGLI
jgi:hypothetical protein